MSSIFLVYVTWVIHGLRLPQTKKHRQQLDKLTETLLEKETLQREEIDSILES